ncbi:MAG TPA: hypothetical protein VF469_09535 [Kofleriaceae bacterium]
MTLNPLTNNVSDGRNTCLISGDVLYFVDRAGNVSPSNRQCTKEHCHLFLNDKDPHTPFKGYICAQQNGACRCAELVADLHDNSHLQPRCSPYVIAAALGEYQLVSVSTAVAKSLTPFATNGDLHVGPNGGELPLGLAGRAPRSDLAPGDHE